MKFLALTRRRLDRFSEAEFAEVLGAEAEAARALYARGAFREINSRGDVPGAAIVLEAPDLEGARALIGELPLAQREMMDVELVPLLPYRGFVGG
jgi:hypothetical protein